MREGGGDGTTGQDLDPVFFFSLAFLVGAKIRGTPAANLPANRCRYPAGRGGGAG